MKYFRNKQYCGPPSAEFRSFLGKRTKNEMHRYFGKKRIYYTHKARVAIRRACALLGIGKDTEVLAPAYNCGSEIDALVSSTASVVLYRINRAGQIDFDDLERRVTPRTKVVYITHYFGFPQPLAEINNLCMKKGIYLIEDCALSLFSSNGKTQLGSTGDISIYNFPKTLPVPDGGLLVINNADLLSNSWIMSPPPFRPILRKMLPFLKRNVLRASSRIIPLYSVLWSTLKRTQSFPEIDGEKKTKYPDMPASYYYDEKLNGRRISSITKYMLRRFNVGIIVKKRRENYIRLLGLFSGVREIKPLYEDLPEGVSPLHFPILIKNREWVCRRLNELSIAATSWWAGYHSDLPWDDFIDACFLKDNLLALPIHQQLNEENIKYIAEKVMNLVQSQGNKNEF